ncbi:MAG: riboflavin synthase [Lachnospiraceae bacterium]|nr:riboflavin synthase [Lachnospiraceae bacterium]
MFTGIIEEVGTIRGIQTSGHSSILTIGCSDVLAGTKLGDSIALNGICLTVTSMTGSEYQVDVMAETMNRTNLSKLRVGSKVNLERAMAADGRFGGHIVSGHIDGTGTIKEIRIDENAVWYTVAAPESILCYIVEKGSITINGISLTVAYVDDVCFKVSIIPHTRANTNLPEYGVGDLVNLECDILGKYVEKLLRRAPEKKESRITEEFLREHGF